ncbi:MAG: AraC family transcriptional regulator [Flavobacterium sp.]|uniref:helix-turn-helix domain-containing protein n=1 Tax=Flavobacterium sp. TaxID=239 RepID=UPI00120BCB95|nr:AraC family transcriptional regulator [Flavobacterium sp.]RZJ66205.1 MAG: AraC family transcriptional regulator [Flavobacterium sp.]
MNFNVVNSIILAGVVQGLIFCGIVFSSPKYRNRTTTFLVLMILCFSMSNLQYYLDDTNVVSREVFTRFIYVPWAALVAPFLLQFGLSFLNEKPLSKKVRWMYLPFALSFAWICADRISDFFNVREKFFDDAYLYYAVIDEVVPILMNMVVDIVLLAKIIKFEKQHSDFDVNKVVIGLKWLKAILIFLWLLAILWMYLLVLFFLEDESAISLFYPFWIGLAILIYWLGHIGIYKYGIREERKKLRSFAMETSHSITTTPRNDHASAFKELVSGQKLFLDQNLSLDSVSEKLGLSKSHLSRIINSELKTSFPDYLNQLRVDEAKSYLANPDFSNYTLIAIGLEAGFSSKSSFNNAFRKITGETPSEFRKNL